MRFPGVAWLGVAVVVAGVAAMSSVSVAGPATWSPAVSVPGSEAATGALIARADAGADTVAWLQSGAAERVAASTRPLGGAFTTSVLSEEGMTVVDGPAITVDPAGPVTIAWVAQGAGDDDLSRIDFVTGVSGSLGDRQTLPAQTTGADPSSVDVAVTSTGETIFVWTQTIDEITRARALVRGADGSLSPAFTLSDGSGNAAGPRVATAGGGAVVTWLQSASETTTEGDVDTDVTVTRVQSSLRSASGFSAAATVAEASETTITTISGEDETSITTGQRLGSPLAGADDQDGAVVAFLLTDVDSQNASAPETSVAHAATGTLTSGLGGPVAVSLPDHDAADISLSVARSGVGLLAWVTGSSVEAARRAAGGGFAAAEQVVAAGGEPATAIRADGTPIVVFSAGGQIFASVGLAAGGYEAPVALGPAEPPSASPAVGADARGGAAASWLVDPTPETGDESVSVAELQPEPETPPPPPPPAPPPPTPEAPPPPPAEPPPPSALTLTSFAVTPNCIRYGAPATGTRGRLTFAFVLSEAAAVRLTIQRRLNSVAQRRCPSARTRGQAGRLGPPVVIDQPSAAGPNGVTVGEEGEAMSARAARGTRGRVAVTRRLKAGRRRIVLRQSATTLAPGTYVAAVTAVTADHRATAPIKAKFWVLRSP